MDQAKHFNKTLVSIANETKTQTLASNKLNTPLFNNDWRTLNHLHKDALRKFNIAPTTINLNAITLLRLKNMKNS